MLQQHDVIIPQSRVRWEKSHFSWNTQLSIDQESSSLSVWEALEWVILLPHFQEDYHGLGPSGHSSRETAFSIRRIEPELLQLSQLMLSQKAIKFLAPLCAKLISIWLWIVNGYFFLNESIVWVKNILGGREIALLFWGRCPMSHFSSRRKIFCRIQKLTALSR